MFLAYDCFRKGARTGEETYLTETQQTEWAREGKDKVMEFRPLEENWIEEQTPLAGGTDNGRGSAYGGQGTVWGTSVVSSKFCYERKTALEIKTNTHLHSSARCSMALQNGNLLACRLQRGERDIS